MADRQKRKIFREQRAAAPTPASQWKRPDAQTATVVLPSGNAATLKQPDLVELLAGGVIPDGLGSFMSRVVDAAGGGDEGVGQLLVSDPENLGRLNKLVGSVCRAVFAEPAIAPEGEEPGEGEIALEWLTFEDKMAVFNHVMGGADALLPFPGEAAAGDQPALAGEDVPQPAE